MSVNPQIPNQAMPIVSADGRVTQPWFVFLQNLVSKAGGIVGNFVATFNGRSGAVILGLADIVAALGFTPGQGTVTTTGTPTAGQIASFSGPTSITGVSLGSVSMKATVAITSGQLVAFTSTGLILADATDATKPACGWAMATVAAGAYVNVGLPGSVNTALTGLTAGSPYFLSTGGAVTSTVPTSGANQFVGYATPGGNLLFQPGPDMAL